VTAASKKPISSKESRNSNPNTSEANCEKCVQILLRNRTFFLLHKTLWWIFTGVWNMGNWERMIEKYATQVFVCLKFHLNLIPRLNHLVTI
jgi:hypothetical protein